MNVVVKRVARDRAGRIRFWRAGLAPYDGDRHHVTPLLMDQHARWSPEHPFFRHAEAQHFVAHRDGHDVGRIAACVDERHDEYQGGRVGFFGWFECEERAETATALLGAAAAWLRERGRETIRGPLSYSTNGLSGLLVEDAQPGPPALDMPYNPPWYADLLAAWGLRGVKDLIAFWVPTPKPGTDWLERLARVVRRIEKRGNYVLRPVRTDAAGYAEDVEHVLDIYNAAWEKNWGFVPMTPDEIRHESRTMRQLLLPSMLLFVERAGEPVAFSLTLPDMNQALRSIHGRLWPWSTARLLLAKRRIRRGRMITLGVKPEHRRAGLETALILRSLQGSHRLGWEGAECSWVLEDNDLMSTAIKRIGGEPYRRYRIFEAPIPQPDDLPI
jgi:hypothetical protein